MPVGPAIILPPTVLAIFQLFFTTAVVDIIVRETNIYAQQVLGRLQERNGRMSRQKTSEHSWDSLC